MLYRDNLLLLLCTYMDMFNYFLNICVFTPNSTAQKHSLLLGLAQAQTLHSYVIGQAGQEVIISETVA